MSGWGRGGTRSVCVTSRTNPAGRASAAGVSASRRFLGLTPTQAPLPTRPTRPGGPTCSSVRRRNSWDSSSGCSSNSESVQPRPPTSPAIIVARNPRWLPTKLRVGSVPEVTFGRGLSCVVTLGAPLVRFSTHGLRLAGLALSAYFLGSKKRKGLTRVNWWHLTSGRNSGESIVHGTGDNWSRFL